MMREVEEKYDSKSVNQTYVLKVFRIGFVPSVSCDNKFEVWATIQESCIDMKLQKPCKQTLLNDSDRWILQINLKSRDNEWHTNTQSTQP